ncbi:MAG: hypothetical protein AB1630_00505 [bacterium]
MAKRKIHFPKESQETFNEAKRYLIFGYYQGGISVGMIKEGFQKAKFIIDTLTIDNIKYKITRKLS